MNDFAPSWLKVGPYSSTQQTGHNGKSDHNETSMASLRPLKYAPSDSANYKTNGSLSQSMVGHDRPAMSSLELEFRKQLDFTQHIPPSSTAAANNTKQAQQQLFRSTHSFDEDDHQYHQQGNGFDKLPPQQAVNNRQRSYNRNKNEPRGVNGGQRRAQSGHDFREMANFQHHSKPSSNGSENGSESSDVGALDNPTVGVDQHHGNGAGGHKNQQSKSTGNKSQTNESSDSKGGPNDIFLQEFPSLGLNGDSTTSNSSPGTAKLNSVQQQAKTVWDSAQAKSKVLNGRTQPNLTSLGVLTTKPKVEDLKKSATTGGPSNSVTSDNTGRSAPPPSIITLAKKKPALKDALINIGQPKVLPSTLFTSVKKSAPAVAPMEILVKNQFRARLGSNRNDLMTMSGNRSDSLTSSKDDLENVDNTNHCPKETNGMSSSTPAIVNNSSSSLVALPLPIKPPTMNNSVANPNEKTKHEVGSLTAMIEHMKQGRDMIRPRHGDNRPSMTSVDLLSSSLEAEQRLLKEMGWTGDDEEDVAPITEEEVNEFKNKFHGRSARPSLTTTAIRHIDNHYQQRENSIDHNSGMNQWSPRRVGGVLNGSIAASPRNESDDDSSSSSDEDDDVLMV